ncbi:MAG: hypothetical protein ABSA02_05290 [Trebonia sp.]|jgi:hypothetical protein
MTDDPASGGPGAAYGEALIVADPRRLVLDESRQEIYSTPVGVRLLYQDPPREPSTTSSATRRG